MVARMVTVLILLVVVGWLSWGMRADAQSGTLEARVATLEMHVADLSARALPPPGPPQYLPFVVFEDAHTFQMTCSILEHAANTGQYDLTCTRFASESSASARPTAQARCCGAVGGDGPLLTIRFQRGETLLPGGCVRVTNDAEAFSAELCDDDGQDGDPTPGLIALSVVPGRIVIEETRPPDGYRHRAEPIQITIGATKAMVTFNHL
jgi:hypothetical protein